MSIKGKTITRVQLPPPKNQKNLFHVPFTNKVDSFDTRVSETINLFLFAKMLAAQGFLVLWFYGIVSLWVSGWGDFSPLWMPSFCIDNSHAETFL